MALTDSIKKYTGADEIFHRKKKNEADKVKDMDFMRVGGGSFQALSDKTKIFIETHAETFLRPRPRLFLDQ